MFYAHVFHVKVCINLHYTFNCFRVRRRLRRRRTWTKCGKQILRIILHNRSTKFCILVIFTHYLPSYHLKLKVNILIFNGDRPYIAIPIYTVLPYCVIRVSRAGVTVLNPTTTLPLPGPPTPNASVAASAQQFKQWLDTLFVAAGIQGNMVTDFRNRRCHGFFDHIKCPEAYKFLQALSAYNWANTAGMSAGTLFLASGSEGTLKLSSIASGPFQGHFK